MPFPAGIPGPLVAQFICACGAEFSATGPALLLGIAFTQWYLAHLETCAEEVRLQSAGQGPHSALTN